MKSSKKQKKKFKKRFKIILFTAHFHATISIHHYAASMMQESINTSLTSLQAVLGDVLELLYCIQDYSACKQNSNMYVYRLLMEIFSSLGKE